MAQQKLGPRRSKVQAYLERSRTAKGPAARAELWFAYVEVLIGAALAGIATFSWIAGGHDYHMHPTLGPFVAFVTAVTALAGGVFIVTDARPGRRILWGSVAMVVGLVAFLILGGQHGYGRYGFG